MNVLIVERDKLVGTMLADALDAEGFSVELSSNDEEALKLPPDDAPQVVITGINRGHNEDLTGLNVVSAMRRNWPQLCAVYLSALWPVRLRREMLAAGERFFTKPVHLALLIRAVRELLNSDLCRPAKLQS